MASSHSSSSASTTNGFSSLLGVVLQGQQQAAAAQAENVASSSTTTPLSGSQATLAVDTTPAADHASSSPLTSDPAYDPSLTSPLSTLTSSQLAGTREVSLVEHGRAQAGVVFVPPLRDQRKQWLCEVLRKEGVGSVLEVGCGEGSLLNALVQPATSIPEPPIRDPQSGKGEEPGLFLHILAQRLAGLDVDPTVIPRAVAATAPPTGDPEAPPALARWQRLDIEIWQGGLERHNHRLEGFEAIVASEVIEHLDGPSLAVFPQMIFGTFRPRIVLITTPNFTFNSKFPRQDDAAARGFLDPTGRTQRVFRHSDHKIEMNEEEFTRWCEAAEDWGYRCSTGGLGLSDRPSYHDNDPQRPIYATQTAVFYLGGQPARSPRSVRTSELPFMPGSGEALHPHRLAARHVHEPTKVASLDDAAIRGVVERAWEDMSQPSSVSIDELWFWNGGEVARAAAGSRRRLVRALGGWGDCPGRGEEGGWEVFWPDREGAYGLRVRRRM